MTNSNLATIADVRDLLRTAGYAVQRRNLADKDAILAETPYALVACAEFATWEQLQEQVSDLQAAATGLAAEQSSARSWDVYVVALVNAPGEAHDDVIAETIEADTSYARKFVRAAVRREDLDRALRPLLPLRGAAKLQITDPLAELRTELRDLDVPDDVADVAVSSFAHTEEVQVP